MLQPKSDRAHRPFVAYAARANGKAHQEGGFSQWGFLTSYWVVAPFLWAALNHIRFLHEGGPRQLGAYALSGFIELIEMYLFFYHDPAINMPVDMNYRFSCPAL